MASHNLHQQTSWSVLHCLESSNQVQTDLMGHHLLHQRLAAAPMNGVLMRTQSPYGQLASVADAVWGLVRRQYHSEQHQFPVSIRNPHCTLVLVSVQLPFFSERLVIVINRRFMVKGMKIASGKSPILPIHSPDGDAILQSSTTNPWN